MPAEEVEEREELLAEVMDPGYLMGRDVDAEGEAEIQGVDMSVDFGSGVLNGGGGGASDVVATSEGGEMVDVMGG